MDHPPNARSTLVSVLLFLGLLGMGSAFMMRGNNWLVTAPFLGIQHPIAAGVGVVGILLCLASVGLRRLGGRGDAS